MALDQFILSSIQQTRLSTAIRSSHWAVMGLESVHLLGMALLGGGVIPIALAAVRHHDLRGLPLMTLVRGLRPLLVTGLVIMAVSGALIAQSMPYKYYLNGAFRIKMLSLVGAVSIMAWLSRTTDTASLTVRRALALLSLLLWLGVAVSGRLIGYL